MQGEEAGPHQLHIAPLATNPSVGANADVFWMRECWLIRCEHIIYSIHLWPIWSELVFHCTFL